MQKYLHAQIRLQNLQPYLDVYEDSGHLLTYSMVQSPSWEANWFPASQEIPRISRNPKVHYHTHKRPPPVSTLGQLNPVLLDFITRTILGEEYKSFSSSLCNILHSPVTSSLLDPNILLNTIFSNTLSFLSSRDVSDQVSLPHKTTGKILVLYILIFEFLDSNLEDKRFCTEW